MNRPINGHEHYDLDLACELREEITKSTWTQEQLKAMLRRDLDKYRRARNIQAPLEERNRCWSMEYQDQLPFHIDVIPCIPEERSAIGVIRQQMMDFGIDEGLSSIIADLSVSITDRRRPNYRTLSLDWLVSNPEGFAKWFEYRMKLAAEVINRRLAETKAARVDDLPTYRWKTPLQRAVQILKRHRDVMFEHDSERKPISIIITTLAGHAYQGENTIFEALRGILNRMENFISASKPRVPNPVNPTEDFADKWDTAKGQQLQLERNFFTWLRRAQADIELLGRDDVDFLWKHLKEKFGVNIPIDEIRGLPGLRPKPQPPKRVNIVTPASPWCR